MSIPLVSYTNGTRPEIEAIIEHAHSVGALVFVDAYQGAGVVPISAIAKRCDYLVSGNLKYLLGLPGIAILYVRDCVNVERNSALTGWFGRIDPFAFDATTIDYPMNARRFELGTYAIPSAYAGVAGFKMISRMNPDTGWNHIKMIREELTSGLTDLGLEIDYPGDVRHRGPQVAVLCENPEGIAEKLALHRIGTAPRGKRLRLSLHSYTNREDLNKLFEAFKQLT